MVAKTLSQPEHTNLINLDSLLHSISGIYRLIVAFFRLGKSSCLHELSRCSYIVIWTVESLGFQADGNLGTRKGLPGFV